MLLKGSALFDKLARALRLMNTNAAIKASNTATVPPAAAPAMTPTACVLLLVNGASAVMTDAGVEATVAVASTCSGAGVDAALCP